MYIQILVVETFDLVIFIYVPEFNRNSAATAAALPFLPPPEDCVLDCFDAITGSEKPSFSRGRLLPSSSARLIAAANVKMTTTLVMS